MSQILYVLHFRTPCISPGGHKFFTAFSTYKTKISSVSWYSLVYSSLHVTYTVIVHLIFFLIFSYPIQDDPGWSCQLGSWMWPGYYYQFFIINDYNNYNCGQLAVPGVYADLIRPELNTWVVDNVNRLQIAATRSRILTLHSRVNYIYHMIWSRNGKRKDHYDQIL